MNLTFFIFRPRTVPAIAVIFNEARDMTGTIRKRDINRLYHMIKKRSQSPFSNSDTKIGLPSLSEIKYAVQKIQPKTVIFLKKAWNSLNRFRVWIAKKMYKSLPGGMKKIVKKLGRFEALLHKKLVCLKPRLKRRYGLLIYPEGLTVKAIIEKKRNFFHDIKFGDAEDDHVEFIEDCFEDMERPKFGWRVKVTLMEEEPCIFNTENPELSTCRINSTRTSGSSNNLIMDNAQRRQTLEEFRSAAPTDCRIRYIC